MRDLRCPVFTGLKRKLTLLTHSALAPREIEFGGSALCDTKQLEIKREIGSAFDSAAFPNMIVTISISGVHRYFIESN